MSIGENESRSISVSKIENGYLRTESRCAANGAYESKTTYYKTNPGTGAPGEKTNAGVETARRAEALLNRKR